MNFSCRIEQTLLGNMMRDATSSAEKKSMLCQGIINAVNMHKRAIEFVLVCDQFLFIRSNMISSSIFQ